MAEVQQTIGIRHLLYPKCPYNNSVIVLVLRLGLIALGTFGISFFNVWVAVVYLIYSVWFNLFVWPIKHCRNCYYKIKEATVDEKTGKTTLTLLSVDEWKETYLEKHVACGKKWFWHSYILWLGPIVLIPISFLWNFSVFALISLIGFIAVLAGTLLYVRFRVCPSCAFMDECHAAF
ncbi:MAG: hypothetical protein ACW991_06645 [Candidatus Hodarchaeales archaeon]|jgi:hypothetical protein